MDVLIDDQLADPPIDPSQTMSALIDEVRGRLSDTGRMVVSIECDGVELNADELDRAMTRSIGTYGRLAMRTCAPAELVEGALDQALSCLRGSRAQCSTIVKHLAESNSAKAMSTLAGVLGTWHQVHEGMRNAIGLLGVDVARLSTSDVDIVVVFGEVRDLLIQIKEVVEARDTVLLGDLLQYELDPVVDRWERAIQCVRDHAAGLIPAGAA